MRTMVAGIALLFITSWSFSPAWCQTAATAASVAPAPTALTKPASPVAASACPDLHKQLGEALKRVQDYQQKERAMHQALGAYTTDISALIMRWHDNLKQQMEGKTVKVPLNYFGFMTEGASNMTEATGWVFQNSDILLDHIDKLTALLNNCYQATAPVQTTHGPR